MSFWKKLFRGGPTGGTSKGVLSPDTIAEIGITAHKLARAGLLLNNVKSPTEGRAAMAEVAQIFDSIGTGRPPADILRNTSDLDDDQILPLCQQMAASLAQQSRTMAKFVEEQSGKL